MPAREQKAEGKRQKAVVILPTAFCLLLTACAVTRPVVKIALVAPYEGRYRDVGLDVIFAVRLAVREANAAGGVAGYSVELVSLDDSGDEEMAREQARKLATDPLIVGVIGHWLEATTLAAAGDYAEAGLPLLATAAEGSLPAPALRLWPRSACHLTTALGCAEALEDLKMRGVDSITVTVPAPLPADSSDPGFAERYRAVSGGPDPGFNAVLAYDAARLLFDAIARDVEAHGTATSSGVAAALAESDLAGLSGRIRFDETGDWVSDGPWTYTWRNGRLITP
jgi:ABC-type branched-subunit amino acid transport system substrate-binding protein